MNEEMNMLIIIGDLEVQNRKLKFQVEQLQQQVAQLNGMVKELETKTEQT